MTAEYPYNGRLSRWEEIAPGLAIVGVQALEESVSIRARPVRDAGSHGTRQADPAADEHLLLGR